MIAVIDYGAGNLGSVYKALRSITPDVRVTSDPAVVAGGSHLVLPGVGAFSHCMQGLVDAGMSDATRAFIASGRPFLGICVGLQMLFDSSEEPGDVPGLGILAGRVVRFRFDSEASSTEARTSTLKVPHIGWNELAVRDDRRSPLFAGLNPRDRVYFVHSYYPRPADPSVVAATSDYGGSFCCAIQHGNVHATQFHPEKSGAVGLRILRNFTSLPA